MKEFLVRELLRLVSIPSVTGEEGDILAYLASFLEEADIPFTMQGVEHHWYNLLVNHSKENRLLITSHVDTVAPVDGIPPMPERRGDKIWGLGVCDDKAGVAIMMGLIKRFSAELEHIPITFAFMVDEEGDGKGSEALVKDVLIPWAVVMEPTRLQVATAQAGSIELDLAVKGQMAHGSYLEDGESAIEKAIALIAEIKELPILKDSHPLLGSAALNIEKLWGGDGELRVPDRCEIRLELRIPLQLSIKSTLKEISIILEKEGVSYCFNDISAPFEIDRECWLVKALLKASREELGIELSLGAMKSWTDAAHLYQAGIIPVIFGPGDLAHCHTPEEHIEIEEVITAYMVMESFLRVCSREGIPRQ